MLRRLTASSLEFRFLVMALAALLLTYGASRIRTMPVDVFPEFGAPMVEVQTEALGLSAAEVENLITLNLEELLSGVSWLKAIRSESVPGLSSIRMVFEPGTDVSVAARPRGAAVRPEAPEILLEEVRLDDRAVESE